MYLKLNPSKFELIFFNNTRSTITFPSLRLSSIDSFSLDPSPVIRSLGFLFESNLSLTHQISSVTKSCFFHLRRIKQLLPFLDDPTLQLLVSSLVLSRIDYCNSLYYGLPESTLYPLTKAFNSAARLVSRTSMFCRISPFLVKLHWLPLKYRIIFKICLLMFKIINTPSPSYLTNLISAPKRANLRSSSNRIYLNPIKHTFAKRSFSFCGPYLWSRLPSSLSTLGSLTAFRRDLKTHLFRCFVAERL
mgnify:FL=1